VGNQAKWAAGFRRQPFRAAGGRQLDSSCRLRLLSRPPIPYQTSWQSGSRPMAPSPRSTAFLGGLAGQAANLALPVAMLLAILVVLAPVPAPVVDLLLAANLTVAVLALLGALAARSPLEMAAFPSFLLAATLVRLVLNIATTRLILAEAGRGGPAAAGEVIQAFSSFVAADNLVVGAVVFAIIAVIQFAVLTAGATRTSEVAARFTLDGLPGRQAAIDAEVAAGGLTQDQARSLRSDLQRQAEFYASMDGASRFVRGEAVASVVIVLVNLVGGFAIGMGQLGLPATDAAGLYARLTIGDGLASAVPSLLVSVATGLLLSRSTTSQNLPVELGRQLFARPVMLLVTAAFLGLLALSDLPTLPLAVMAGGVLVTAWLVQTTGKRNGKGPLAGGGPSRAAKAAPIDAILGRNRLTVRLGRELVSLAAGEQPSLPVAVEGLRARLVESLGLLVPAMTFQDDPALPPRAWTLDLDGEPILEADLPFGRQLLVPAAADAITRQRWQRDPAGTILLADRPARWGSPAEADEVATRGGETFAAAAAVARLLEDALLRHADRLLSRDQTARMLESLRATEPAVVEQTVPAVVSVATVQRTLQYLLRDGVPIKPLAGLLETLADHAAQTNEPGQLAEYLRRQLAGTIIRRLRGPSGQLALIRLTPAAVQRLAGRADEAAERLAAERLIADLRRAVRPLRDRGRPCAIVVTADRLAVAERLRAAGITVPVLAEHELAGQPGLEAFALVSGNEGSGPAQSRAA
jgi:flagellar biosynthesis protein FlhA